MIDKANLKHDKTLIGFLLDAFLHDKAEKCKIDINYFLFKDKSNKRKAGAQKWLVNRSSAKQKEGRVVIDFLHWLWQ